MNERRTKRMGKTGFLVVLLVLLLQLTAVSAFAQTGPEVMQVVSSPSDGCTLVGIRGEFVSNADAALKRINEIRLEACREGVKNPRTNSNLTEADYVPIQWSADLEYIARVRAAEASLVTSHTRPNGDVCFSVETPNGVPSSGEVLAWNYSKTMMQGIEQWYGEKRDWVNHTGGVTGHYTQMIDPTNTYVGLGCFLSPTGVYPNTTSGEYGKGTDLDTTQASGIADCMVITEIKQSALSSPTLKLIASKKATDSALDVNDTLQYALMMQTTLEGEKAFVQGLGNVTWTSSDPAVASVDSNGNVKINDVGIAEITATNDAGQSASVKLSPAHTPGAWTGTKAATFMENGIKEQKCAVCGKGMATQEIAKIQSVRLLCTSYTYSGGKQRKPAVVAMDADGKEIPMFDYTVIYKNNREVGTATATIVFNGNYEGTATKTFKIIPKSVTELKVTAVKKGFTAKWKKPTGQISGYQVQYSRKSDFSAAKRVSVKKSSTVSKKVTKLSAKKTYYVRVRSYTKVDGKTYYSGWSKRVKVKTKG